MLHFDSWGLTFPDRHYTGMGSGAQMAKAAHVAGVVPIPIFAFARAMPILRSGVLPVSGLHAWKGPGSSAFHLFSQWLAALEIAKNPASDSGCEASPNFRRSCRFAVIRATSSSFVSFLRCFVTLTLKSVLPPDC